jgi:phosphoglycolate phosphatase
MSELLKKYSHIIWDWNGTLLDDVDIVISAMNQLLSKRNLPLLDLERYKNIFTFPVEDYYLELGFNFEAEPFERLASEFISEFSSGKYQFKLHLGTHLILNYFIGIGKKQSVLSASQEKSLCETIKNIGISQYFSKIAGLDNHYAVSKVDRGKRLLEELNVNSQEAVLIGDTLHDFEVASELGCDCILISNGHQSYDRLSRCDAIILNTISDLQ